VDIFFFLGPENEITCFAITTIITRRPDPGTLGSNDFVGEFETAVLN